jgi:plastocyanin
VIQLGAAALAFQPNRITVSTGQSVTVRFNNTDAGVVHDVQFRIPGGPITGSTCQGPCSYELRFTAPGPGAYQFVCVVHEYADMSGFLIVR